MALTGKLLADFTDFQSAVQKADVSLKSFETGAGKVSTALNKMADSFSGRKVIQDAELATKAISEIGGATKLTESEQAKLNAQLTEAIAKYAALGQEAPADMVALQKATAGAQSTTTDMLGTFGKIASAVGIGFSIGAVVNFGKAVFESASQIGDLAKQLGISTDAVQGFKFAAEQSGSTLDAVGASIQKMNQNLGAGSNSTVQALKDLGLSFQDIRRMSPEDAFLAITDALEKTTDPMKEARLQAELFGKGSIELTAAIKEGFREQSDAALKMSQDTIKALKDAQDAWNRLGTAVTVVSGNLIAAIGDVATSLFSLQRSGKEWLLFLENSVKFGPGAAAAMLDVAAAAEHAAASVGKVPSRAQLFGVHVPTQEELDAQKKYAEAIRELTAAITPLTQAQQASVLAFDRQGASAEQIAKVLKVSATAITNFLTDIQTKGKTELDDWAEVVRRHQEEQRQGEAETLAAIEKLRQDELDVSTAALADWAEVVRHHQEEQRKGEEATLAALKKNASESAKALGDLSQALSQLAQISGTAFGAVVSGLAQIVAAANTAEKAIASMKSGLQKDENGKGKGLAGILEISTGIIGIVAAAIQAGKAIKDLFGLFDRNKGRDLVVDFAETFGGFDALHDKLLMLGADGEALWIKLTQGVGRNNPQQAQQVIDEINKALDEQAKKHDENQTATEEEAQATIETATQAKIALDELGVRLDQSKEEWKDWSTVVTGALQTLADTIRSLPVPSPGGVSPGASVLPFSAGKTGGSATIHTHVNIDGKQVAESVAYQVLN